MVSACRPTIPAWQSKAGHASGSKARPTLILAVSLGFANVAAEIQLLACEYLARCSVPRCRSCAPSSPGTPTAEVGRSSSANYAIDTPPGSKQIVRTFTNRGVPDWKGCEND